MTDLPDVLALASGTRDYAWGSPTAIPELRGETPTGDPVAELWIGAHPGLPSQWAGLGLDAVVAGDPLGTLGIAATERFGPRLPFLLKLLAAERALSLQVHPNTGQAHAGFARENDAAIPIGAPTRNYQDDNHKPELLCALTPFEALCGFRDPTATVELLRAIGTPETDELAGLVQDAPDLRPAVDHLLGLDAATAAAWTSAVATAARASLAADGDRPFRAELDCFVRLAGQFPDEIGPVLALLPNLVQLAPGESVFLAAGQIHAYVRGFGVEILANSDNVLRCGLTPKHVDVPELLHIASFAPVPGRPSVGVADGALTRYPVPVDDFELVRVEVGVDPVEVTSSGPVLLVATSGRLVLHGGDGSTTTLAPGASAFVPAGRAVTATGDGTLFRAAAGPAVTG